MKHLTCFPQDGWKTGPPLKWEEKLLAPKGHVRISEFQVGSCHDVTGAEKV